jgi:hypothetical protein
MEGMQGPQSASAAGSAGMRMRPSPLLSSDGVLCYAAWREWLGPSAEMLDF